MLFVFGYEDTLEITKLKLKTDITHYKYDNINVILYMKKCSKTHDFF